MTRPEFKIVRFKHSGEFEGGYHYAQYNPEFVLADEARKIAAERDTYRAALRAILDYRAHDAPADATAYAVNAYIVDFARLTANTALATGGP